MRKLTIAAFIALLVAILAGCGSQADTVNNNISNDADQFKVYRSITFINGINGGVLLNVLGYCSIDTSNPRDLTVTCKVGDGDNFMRDYLGSSDNVTWVIQQLKPDGVNKYHYEFNLRPTTLIPDVRIN